jgi:hypothetical protein
MNGVEVAHTYDIDTEKEFLIITTTEEILRKGSNVYLRVEYLGFISADEQIGVFRGEYQNADRRKRFKKNCFSLKKFIEKKSMIVFTLQRTQCQIMRAECFHATMNLDLKHATS